MEGLPALLTAIGAGIATFISPCVLPLVPGYLAFMTGMSSSELAAQDRRSSAVLVPALLFVAGFTTVFVALGATASALGAFLTVNRAAFETAAGLLVIAFGFLMLGILKMPWLYGEARFDMQKTRRFGAAAALVMGMAFAFGWSPCVGPILGSILMMAASSAEAGRGALLLATYSLGLGIPFVAVALMLGRLRPMLRWLNRHALAINRVAGIVLILLGVLILTDWIGPVVGLLSAVIPKIGG
ncbi:MAG: cytochrome c biogenesis protein CcdA [Actinobacteria bacterium]|nr:cytochrome c biogenesis protein CcdA [Actinomycetota bacterium]